MELKSEELAAEKQYFDAVLDSMSDGVLVCEKSPLRSRSVGTVDTLLEGWVARHCS